MNKENFALKLIDEIILYLLVLNKEKLFTVICVLILI